MFGKNEKKESPAPANPRMRSSIYGMAALYLLYLYYKEIALYRRGEIEAPVLPKLILATIVLLGGGALLGVLSWKLYKQGKAMEAEALKELEAEENETADDEDGEDFDEEEDEYEEDEADEDYEEDED